MTTALELGTIESIRPRTIWRDEARDFTPWLAENISLLGDALGINLECRKREAAVGIYSLDILAHDTERDLPVAIENQLGVTDHSHLGQVITYAGGYDASVIVWVAGAFRDEHRQALDLLNRRTDDNTEFYGVEVEVLKIGNSRSCVNFKLVAIPRRWRNPKQISGRSGGVRHDERYRQFYRELVKRLKYEEPGFADLSDDQIGTAHYCILSSFGKNVRYAVSFGDLAGRRNTAWVQLIIGSGDRDWDKEVLNHLHEHKEEIESVLDGSPLWRPDHSRDDSRIMLPSCGSINESPETLQELREWMVDRLLKFKEVFGPRLAELVD